MSAKSNIFFDCSGKKKYGAEDRYSSKTTLKNISRHPIKTEEDDDIDDEVVETFQKMGNKRR